MEPHPNADSLSMVKVFGYNCAVRTDDWADGDLAVYIPPESIVPDEPQFAFLKGHLRIKARKFRGYHSQGLLVPAPEGACVGDDCMEQMGVVHWEPVLRMSGGEDVQGPEGYYPHYDVENYRRYFEVFVPGEEVVATEKIHGANAKFTWVENQLWIGSRTNWKADDSRNPWSVVSNQCPWIREWCEAHPGLVVYGEVFGRVQSLRYGIEGKVSFVAFDILDKDRWLDFDEAQDMGRDLVWVPLLYRGSPDETRLLEVVEQDSALAYCLGRAHQLQEGIVIKPTVERIDVEIGRVQLKLKSYRYEEK